MKPKLRKIIKDHFMGIAKELIPPFIDDPVHLNNAQFCAVRRQVSPGHWQFIAISFSPTSDRFYLEVAIADEATYPINAFPLGPNDQKNSGTLRFRAEQLWSKSNKSGGWLIQVPDDEPACDIVFPPEGVFATPEAAMSDVKERVQKWVLPYLHSANVVN